MHTHHTWYAFMARFHLQMNPLFWHYAKSHPENMVARTLLVEHTSYAFMAHFQHQKHIYCRIKLLYVLCILFLIIYGVPFFMSLGISFLLNFEYFISEKVLVDFLMLMNCDTGPPLQCVVKFQCESVAQLVQ